MLRMLTLTLVDVFAESALAGNPLAVVSGSQELTVERMLAITRWLNFSETTFLLPPADSSADYRVRIFTPDRELPFAGHPTLGTCHTWLTSGGEPRDPDMIVQECGAGLVRIRRDAGRLAFEAPPLLRSGPVSAQERAAVVKFLGIDDAAITDIAWADNGPGWIAVLLGSAADVLALRPSPRHTERIEVGVVGPIATGHDAAFELRAFFTDQTFAVREDPVTGSLNASVAQWLFSTGRAAGHYIAAQGTALGRSGRVRLNQDGAGAVWVGGACHIVSSGTVAI